MTFHIPSFLIGFVAGAGTKALASRLRPLALEIATAGFKVARSVGTQAARGREDLEDLLAEARARARGEEPAGGEAQGPNGGPANGPGAPAAAAGN